MSRLVSTLNFVQKRCISLSAPCEGKRNFKKFMLINKRGTKLFKKMQTEKPHPDIPINTRGTRPTGHPINGRFVPFPEMIPELIVPDLTDCDLKPYVSYKAPEVIQSEFTPEFLFNAVYGEKIVKDYKNNKLDENGNPLEPTEEEKLTPEEATNKAKRTGCDIFTHGILS